MVKLKVDKKKIYPRQMLQRGKIEDGIEFHRLSV